MKTPLKAGDRVAAYNSSDRFVGTVIRHHDDQSVSIQLDNETDDVYHRVHTKQCRRLIKKPKRKPREFWLTRDIFGNKCSDLHVYGNKPIWARDVIHVREVLKKEQK